MRIALGLPSRVPAASGELMLEWATRADHGPFSSVVVTDRVVSQALEPLSVLAMAAGATQRIRLMTSVVIGPTRETTLLARQAATIDVISNGRLTLGIGIGVRENDYLATGLDFHRRGRRIEEQLPILRRLWAGEALSNEMGPIGPRIDAAQPGQSCSSAATCRRSCGASPSGATATWRPVAASRKACSRCGGRSSKLGSKRDARASRAGSAPVTLRWDRMPWIMRRTTSVHNYGYNPELAAKRLRTLPASRAAVEESIKRQADMGVDEFILRPCAEDLDQMERLAEVAARFS